METAQGDTIAVFCCSCFLVAVNYVQMSQINVREWKDGCGRHRKGKCEDLWVWRGCTANQSDVHLVTATRAHLLGKVLQ
jgi:hypothetical protein